MTLVVLLLRHELLPPGLIRIALYVYFSSILLILILTLHFYQSSLLSLTTVPLYARGEGRRKSLKVKELVASRLNSRGFAKEIVNS